MKSLEQKLQNINPEDKLLPVVAGLIYYFEEVILYVFLYKKGHYSLFISITFHVFFSTFVVHFLVKECYSLYVEKILICV